MRSRIAYSLAAGCLLMTLASLTLWTVSLWRSPQVTYEATVGGTLTYHMIWLEWGIVAYRHGSWPSPRFAVPEGWHTGLINYTGLRPECWAAWSIDKDGPGPSGPHRTTNVALAGFGIERIGMPVGSVTTVHIPLWFTAALPAFLAYRLFRRARRVPTPGLCPRCGYDVRVQHAGAAAPRCPECGTDLPAPPPHDPTA